MKKTRGFSLVEILLAVSLFGLMVMAFVGAMFYGEESTALSGSRSRAAFLTNEGIEAARSIRDSGYPNLTRGTYGLTTTGNRWNLFGSSDLTDNFFTRSLTVANATISGTRVVTSNVTWQQNLQRTGAISMTTELSNWKVYIGNWGAASIQTTLNLAAAGNGVKVVYQDDYAYVVRSTGTPNFVVVSVNNPATPVVVGSLALAGTPSNIVVSGNYAYISANSNPSELQIVNISTPTAPSLSGVFDAPGNIAATGIAFQNNLVYLARTGNSNNFVVVNVSTPSAPTQVGITSLAGGLNEVVVNDGYAYVTSANNNAEVQVINIANPAAPALVATDNLGTGSDAISIAYLTNTLLVGRADGTLQIIDVTIPTAPTNTSTFAAGSQINDISVGLSEGYAFLAGTTGTGRFRVVDVTNLAAPTSVVSITSAGVVNGVVYDPDRDRVYGVQTSGASELVVFRSN